MIEELKPLIGKLTIFAKDRMGFEHPPRLFLRKDTENSRKMLGNTAYYDPQEKAVTLFTHNRHPKDILRSYTHELVHHTQNLRGDLSPEKCGEMGTGYAQKDKHMREMEREAYEKGNMCFRDWEDTLSDKDTYIIIKIAESKILKENKTMTKKITKEFLKETIKRLLSEEPATSTRGMGDMKGFGIDALKNAKIDGGGMKKISKPEAAKEIVDAAKKNPKVKNILDKGILPYLALDHPVKTSKTYGVMPDLTVYKSFNGAYGVAKKMVIPFFYWGRGKKYKIFTVGNKQKPIGTEHLRRAFGLYFSEQEAEIEEALTVLKSDLMPLISAEEEVERLKLAMDTLQPDNALKGIEGAGLEDEEMVAPKGPPSRELEENEELEESGKYDNGNGVDEKCDYVDCNESKIQTPEQENSLYESRFAGRNNRLFENLSKKWTK